MCLAPYFPGSGCAFQIGVDGYSHTGAAAQAAGISDGYRWIVNARPVIDSGEIDLRPWAAVAAIAKSPLVACNGGRTLLGAGSAEGDGLGFGSRLVSLAGDNK